ncbi:MAG: hypothetical protein ACI8XO_002277 [Verrucomicrobiales bacterium]|jgi:hypothetical protein
MGGALSDLAEGERPLVTSIERLTEAGENVEAGQLGSGRRCVARLWALAKGGWL